MSTASIAKTAACSNLRLLGLGEIEVNHAVQSRHAMSKTHEHNLSKIIVRTQQRISAPVIVFNDGSYNILADGFHRYAAAVAVAAAYRSNPDLNHIWADVRPGTMRDAMIFSASCNQDLCLERKEEDIRKAVFMLLEYPEWYQSTIKRIAEHVGIDPGVAKRLRAEFCQKKGIDEPEIVCNKNGKYIAASRDIKIVPVQDESYDYSIVNGVGEVALKYAVVPRKTPRTMPISDDAILHLCKSNGIEAEKVGRKLGVHPYFNGIQGRTSVTKAKFIATTTSLENNDALAAAIGKIKVLGTMSKLNFYSSIVICRPNSFLRKMIQGIEDHCNITFMTPDEFVAFAIEDDD